MGVRRPAKATAVYTIRFTGDELDGLRSVARKEETRISAIVHRAVLQFLKSD